MKLSDPHVPDRSLLLAIAVLGIGLLFAGGGLYVVSGLMGGPSGSGGAIGGGAVAATMRRAHFCIRVQVPRRSNYGGRGHLVWSLFTPLVTSTTLS